MNQETKSNGGASLGCVFMILMIVYANILLWAGFIGIQHHIGLGWAIAAVVVAIIFRFSLPISIGAFFGAMNVWGWHWIGALFFAAPGLAFMVMMIPGVFSSLMGRKGQ